MNISIDKIKSAEKILIDNGIDADEASTVLQAIGFALLDEDLYECKYVAKNIQWDKTDGEGNPIDVDLPNDVAVSFSELQAVEDIADNATDEEILEALSDYLTDKYDFFHGGFVFEKMPSI
jgi:hypothetical protein